MKMEQNSKIEFLELFNNKLGGTHDFSKFHKTFRYRSHGYYPQYQQIVVFNIMIHRS